MNLKNILVNLNPKNFDSKAELYRYLEQSGVGTFEQLKSRYKRNTFSFKDIVDDFFAQQHVSEMRQDLDKEIKQLRNYVHNHANDLEKELEYRVQAYEETRKSHESETQRYYLHTNKKWSVVIAISDLHLDDEGTNVKLLFDVIDYFDSDHTNFVTNGDIGNFWIHNWSQRLGLKSKFNPNDAIKIATFLCQKMGTRHRLAQVGNHDEWVINSIGFDPFESLFRTYNQNILYKYFPTVVKFTNNTTETEWIKFNHTYKGGTSMWNPHQSNIKHLLTKETDVNFTVTGHYHWPVASFAQFPFENRVIKSLLLGSPKSFDEYALQLGMKGNENLNPFGFIFMYNGITEVITDLNTAKFRFKDLSQRNSKVS